ncbi:glycosyltransferase [Vibrio alginolyticus]|uniref:glycosyltransferase n=1 Tax=Vibrio alginolyticus TaxID=663 RepID=UPI0038CD176A|nr:glycosyltransferase [Vibrio alginolyticus]
MKKISILMSLYDKECVNLFALCLDSLVKQTRKADQVVIVLDGPINDELTNIIELFSSKLVIQKVFLESNSGLAVALNEGLKYCSGDLIARMDTDDLCHPDRLKLQEDFILKNKLDILGTAAYIIDLEGNVTGSRINPTEHDDIVLQLWCNPFIHPSVMFRRDAINRIGCYNECLRRRQDYELWFRAARNGLKLGNLDKQLISYRFDLHTLKKQSPKLAWQQGIIGFKGSLACRLGLAKSLVCFIPFIRSLLPILWQVKVTRWMKKLDSRTKL